MPVLTPLVGAAGSSTGAVNSAVAGTAIPTDASTALAAAYIKLGLIGDGGVTETTERGTEQVRSWSGSIARVIQTDFGYRISFVFLITSLDVLREIHGPGNVTYTPADTTAGTKAKISIKINKNELPERVYVVEVKDGDNKIRIAIPRGQITEVGDVNYVKTDVIRYEVTIEAYEDASENNAYKYLAGPVADAG